MSLQAGRSTAPRFLVDLITKLQFSGLSTENLFFEEIDEGRHGMEPDKNEWIVPMEAVLNKIGAATLTDAVQNTIIEMEQMQAEIDAELEFSKQRLKFDSKEMRERLGLLIRGDIL